MEEYYYYEDDYDDEECGSRNSVLEKAYLSAKSLMDANPTQCIDALGAVVMDDADGGKWTFKALKALAKASRLTQMYDDMLRYYEKVAFFSHRDIDKGAVQKAMTKFIDGSHRLPADYLGRVLNITITAASRDLKSFGRLWFNAKIKYATLLLGANDLDSAINEINPVLVWCKEDDPSALRKNTQLLTCYSLLLEAYTLKGSWGQMRDMYLSAISIPNSVSSSRVVGSVTECGGKMYVYYRNWPSAFRAFSVAFRSYNESGDPRRVNCLKYLVLTSMLSDVNIDVFATQETKAYEDTADILPFARLMRAYTRNDVHGFLSTMELDSQSFESEPSIPICLDLLLEKLRLRALVAFSIPYERLCVRRLQDVLHVDKEEVERLCLRAMSDGMLNAAFDSEKGVVTMRKKAATQPRKEQLLALNHWATTLHELGKQVMGELGYNP